MRWKCACAYDGTDFAGWQTQGEHATVQQAVEEALAEILKSKVSIHGSGRTDAGVHAFEQVFHFDFDWRHSGASLCSALATVLPRSIQALFATEVDESFHARFSAVSKRYQYRLLLGQANPFQWPYCWPVTENIDLNRIAAALPSLLGELDFAAFASNRGVEYESTVRHMTDARLYQEGDYVCLSFEANGFLYKMVRSLVGALVNVGLGRLPVEAMGDLIASGKRTPLVQVAPARGLFLQKVLY